MKKWILSFLFLISFSASASNRNCLYEYNHLLLTEQFMVALADFVSAYRFQPKLPEADFVCQSERVKHFIASQIHPRISQVKTISPKVDNCKVLDQKLMKEKDSLTVKIYLSHVKEKEFHKNTYAKLCETLFTEVANNRGE